MLKTFQPSSDRLKKYIEVFYVFSGVLPREFSYIAFPHINTAISIFKGVRISRGNFEVKIETNDTDPNHCCIEILGKYTAPVFVHYKGSFEEVAIVFKPFGINQFIRGDMINYAAKFSQAYTNEKWLHLAEKLFNEEDTAARIELLEDFLLSIFCELENKMISSAIELLSDTYIDHSIESIAKLHSLSVKTFQRQFFKTITCTPSAYKRIARFRHALQTKVLSTEIKSLSDITYESNYYDQSYFIREFKKLTRLNPKKFFETITILDKKKIIWEIK